MLKCFAIKALVGGQFQVLRDIGNMSSAGALKRLVQQAPKAARGVRTGTAVQSGGHGHGTGGYDDYIHAEHMYNLKKMSNRKLKFGAACASLLLIGGGTPFFAIHWQNSKAAG